MESLLISLTAIIAFVFTAVSGIFIIPVLRKLNFGQTIREVGPSWHKGKQGTPTMGGVMFIVGIIIAVSAVLPMSISFLGEETLLMNTRIIAGLVMAFIYGLIGFVDDYIGIKKKRNLGLTEAQKLILQFAIAGGYLFSVYLAGGTSETYIPFIGLIDLGFFYYVFSALIIVGMVNAVNFADGIDGLCSTITFVVSLTFMACSFILNYMGSTILSTALAAACLGFLVWNFNPAKVFMGDTGSLFLGGAVCAAAFSLNMPILLLPVGIMYIVEMASVILQVSYFKITKGKRLFKMAPIHHHFEMKGWSEMKICMIFGIITAIGGAAAVVSLLLS